MTNTKAQWQEIEIRAHNWDEINIDAFWDFLDTAIASFQNKREQKPTTIEAETPWAKLGEKWHYMRKGFSNGEVEWDVEVLKELHGLLQETVPEGKFTWDQKQVVHVYLPDRKEPWASIQTKKPSALTLQLSGPKDEFTLGQVADLADDPELVTKSEDKDVVKLSFTDVAQVASRELKSFLRKHVKVC